MVQDVLRHAADPTRRTGLSASREELPPVFDELLRQRIAATPETAALEWHVLVLDIAKP
jgi:hypothetical protein